MKIGDIMAIKDAHNKLFANPFINDNKEFIEKHLKNFQFEKIILGPLREVKYEDFLKKIDEFFRTFYNDENFMKYINSKIFVYSSTDMLNYIYEDINVDNKIKLAKDKCKNLIDSLGFFLYPTHKNNWSIYVLDLNTIETVFNLVHEYTHKLHFYRIGTTFKNDTGVTSEMVAYYNEFLFGLYLLLDNSFNFSDILLGLSRTGEDIKDVISYNNLFFDIYNHNILHLIDDLKMNVDVDKEVIDSFFSLENYYHCVGYSLFMECVLKNRTFSLDEHADFVKDMMEKRKIKRL